MCAFVTFLHISSWLPNYKLHNLRLLFLNDRSTFLCSLAKGQRNNFEGEVVSWLKEVPEEGKAAVKLTNWDAHLNNIFWEMDFDLFQLICIRLGRPIF